MHVNLLFITALQLLSYFRTPRFEPELSVPDAYAMPLCQATKAFFWPKVQRKVWREFKSDPRLETKSLLSEFGNIRFREISRRWTGSKQTQEFIGRGLAVNK
jgi:hypothetical protein